MGMFGQIKNSVNSILPSLYNDPDLAVEVTWKRFDEETFNRTTGVNEQNYTDFKVKAIRLDAQAKAQGAPGVPMAIGDVVYMFKGPDMPEGNSVRDLLVDGGVTFAIDKITPVFGLVTKVEVKSFA